MTASGASTALPPASCPPFRHLQTASLAHALPRPPAPLPCAPGRKVITLHLQYAAAAATLRMSGRATLAHLLRVLPAFITFTSVLAAVFATRAPGLLPESASCMASLTPPLAISSRSRLLLVGQGKESQRRCCGAGKRQPSLWWGLRRLFFSFFLPLHPEKMQSSAAAANNILTLPAGHKGLSYNANILI